MNNSRPLIQRDKHITEQVVFVDGLTGTGKTMLTPILSTLERMELPRIEHIYEYVCALSFLGRIEDDAAIALLKMYVDLAGYNSAIGRESNFRWSDLSGVWRNGFARAYIRRLFQADGEAVVERMRQRQPILPILSHQALGIMKPLFKALGSRLTVIEMVRHPLYLLEHWYSYIDRHGTDPRDFTIWVHSEGRLLPWFAQGWEQQYVACNKMDRVIHVIDKLTTLSRKLAEEADANIRSKILFIPFERFVQDPGPFLDRIETQLNTKSTPATHRTLRKQKVPRRLFSDGPDQQIYRRYLWRPPSPKSTEADEFRTRWDYAAREATKEGMAVLERISSEYERLYLSGMLKSIVRTGEGPALLQRTP